ncbi:MAG: MATE family efflux transporter [Clostridiales bacterium]|nr:MATE family efflux transporter [Clostridiales bacterium]
MTSTVFRWFGGDILKKLFSMSREDVREIRGMFIPVFIEQLTIALMAMLVSAMVKGSGMAAVASVNLLNSLVMLLQQAYTSIGVGVTVVVAQFLGRGDLKSTGRAAGQAIMLSVYISLFIMAGSFLFLEQLLGMMLGASEPLVYTYSRTYLSYNILSLPFIAIYTVASASIRGSGYPRASLIATLIHNGGYAILGLLAVNVFNAGLEGVSMALLFSRVIAAAASMYLLYRGNSNMQVRKIPFKLEKEIMAPVFKVGIPLFLEQLLFQGGKLITQTFSVAFGTNGIAANGIVNNIHSLQCVPGTAINNAAPPIVAKYCGMGDKAEAKRKGYQFIMLCTLFMTVTSLGIFIFLPLLTGLFTDVAAVAGEVISTLSLICIMVPLFWPMGFTIPAILNSSGDVVYTSTVTVGAMALMRIGIAYYFTQIARVGITGIWFGMYADWIFRIAFLLPRFIKGKWLNKEVIKSSNAKAA